MGGVPARREWGRAAPGRDRFDRGGTLIFLCSARTGAWRTDREDRMEDVAALSRTTLLLMRSQAGVMDRARRSPAPAGGLPLTSGPTTPLAAPRQAPNQNGRDAGRE